MMLVTRLSPENIDQLTALYRAFEKDAVEKYHWYAQALTFDSFKFLVLEGLMSGYMVEETSLSEPIAFMLYRLEEYRAIEINLIYQQPEHSQKVILDHLMKHFIEDIKPLPTWDVVSYALLGEQEKYIRTILWYGFQPLGQAIVKFDILDPLTFQIFSQQETPPLPDGYTLDCWQPDYAEETSQSIYEAFSKAADSLWDPRFRSLSGAQEVVRLLTSGEMGEHLPTCTTILLKHNRPVGFCFLIKNSPTQGNIPLIGLRPTEKNKGFGIRLLKNTLDRCIQEIMAEKLGIYEVNATLETDNIASIRMYRRLGFREEYNYPHVYLPAEALQRQQAGKWC